MIRVMHYVRNLGLGGTEKTCQLFFQNASSDFEVALVHESTGDMTRLDAFREARRKCEGQIYKISSYRDETGASDPKAIPNNDDLQRTIDHFKPDILHVYRSGYQEFPVGQVDVPYIVETNVFGFLDPNPQIDRTLFMSNWLMNFALRGRPASSLYPFKKSRFDFVNNPVEMPATDKSLAIRDFWKKDNPNCIIVGRCGRPDNGIYNSINVDAVRLLRTQGYDIRFMVAGAPSNMVEDLVAYDIPYYLLEITTDPIKLSGFYNSVDIYAHARADGETYGVNIAEAMMHGKPVVTHIAEPSVPGMGVFQSQTELVSENLTGFVCTNNSVDYMNALKKLIDNPELRKEMGNAGLHKATRECHVDICMKKLETIYRDICNK